MGISQKITADRVIGDQIFIINDVLACNLPFAATAATIAGNLFVTVTELDLTIPGSGAVFVTPTIMYQKELAATVTAPTFPSPLPATVPLEYKFEVNEPAQFFCGITAASITALGVDVNYVRAEMVRISSVTDAFAINCGNVAGEVVGSFTESVTTILKIRLVASEDLVVALTPANNLATLPITASCPAG